MKRFISVVLCAMMIGSSFVVLAVNDVSASASEDATPAPMFAGGDGSAGNPWQIEHVWDLQNMSLDVNAHYILINDIDASDTRNWNAGQGFEPVGSNAAEFWGSLNGQNYTIYDLYINRPSTADVGLIGWMENTGSVRNVVMENADITANGYCGALVGVCNSISCEVINCHASGTVNGPGKMYVGGLVGFCVGIFTDCSSSCDVIGGTFAGGLAAQAKTIQNSKSTGSVTGTDYVGGLAGSTTDLVSNCSSSVEASASNNYAGGLIGTSYGIVQDCHSTGSAQGNIFVGGLIALSSELVQRSYSSASATSTGNIVGGLIGENREDIINCYATGSVTGNMRVGGLVGQDQVDGSTTLINCYATGFLTTATTKGGIVSDTFGNYVNCYWDTETTGYGFGAWAATPAGITGLTTAQAMTQASFIGFDFTNTWWMVDGETRPFLRSEWSTEVNNSHQLQMMQMSVGSSYKLNRDIDASDITAPNSMWGSTFSTGRGFYPVGPNAGQFTGALDGQGHVIRNLHIRRGSTMFSGLFGYSFTGSIIENLILEDAYVAALSYTGALVGYHEGTIDNCHVEGSVSGTWWVGGLVGDADPPGAIYDSHFKGSVSGSNENIGGIVGRGDGPVERCYSQGTVTGSRYVGGLVGHAGNSANSDVFDCYSTSSVTASSGSDGGGLVGRSIGDIARCWSSGVVSGSGALIGGFVGDAAGGTRTNCYWDNETSGQLTSGGEAAGQVEGKNLTALLTQSTYSGWDFNNVWVMWENETRPFLRSEYNLSIRNDHQLQLMMMDLAADYEQARDVAMDILDAAQMWGTNISNTGKGFLPVGNSSDIFTGNMDGQDYTIYDLFINRPTENGIGLFGHVDGGVFRSINFIDSNVTGNNFTATLIGDSDSAEVYDCTAACEVWGYYCCGGLIGRSLSPAIIGNCIVDVDVTVTYGVAGGMIGVTASNVIYDCEAYGNVSAGDYTGGLVGYVTGGANLTRCSTYGNVSGDNRVGGIAGESMADIIDSNSYGNITAAFNMIGGIAGVSQDPIINCNFYGFVNGSGSQAGGIVGYHQTSADEVENCTSYGTVQGAYGRVGGIVGYSSSKVNNSHNKGPVVNTDTGTDYVGGIAGRVTSGYVSNCTSEGNVTSAGNRVGGIAGGHENGYIFNCHSSGNISGYDYVGGVAGHSIRNITNSSSSAIVGGHYRIGGIAGYAENNVIIFSNCSGNISGSAWLGGLLGDALNTKVEDCNNTADVTGSDFAGGIAGELNTGSVDRCWVSAIINGRQSTGGIVGYAPGTPIRNCTFTGASLSYWSGCGGIAGFSNSLIEWCTSSAIVDANMRSGGIAGQTQGTVRNCSSSGEIWTNLNAGGLVGFVHPSGSVYDCNTTAFVNAPTRDDVGGLAGENQGLIANSWAQGTVIGAPRTGGLVGWNSLGTIINCWAYASTNGTMDVGGLVGMNGNVIDNCQSWGYVQGSDNDVGGLVGDNNDGTVTNSTSYTTVNNTDINTGGLFGYQRQSGLVENCSAYGDVHAGGHFAGGLIGTNDGRVNDCHAYGDVKGYAANKNYYGGLIGENWGHVTNSSAGGNVDGYDYAGGFIGNNEEGSVNRSIATGHVFGNMDVGGFVGRNVLPLIQECYSTGDANGTGNNIGGFAGENQGAINNTYAWGDASGWNGAGTDNIGGFVGYCSAGTIDDSYSIGKPSGNSNVGGFDGRSDTGVVTDCYWDMDTSGETWSWDVGNNERTTAEMFTQATFVGWNFTDVWGIYESNSYPFLQPLGALVIPQADVEITISDSIDLVTIGKTFYYTVTVTNNGPQNATDVQAIIQLPSETSYVSDNKSIGSVANNVTWNIGALSLNQSAWLSITVQMDSYGSGTVNCTGNVTTDVNDVNLTNSQTFELTQVNRVPSAIDDTATITEESTAILIDVLANDNDPDLDTLLINSYDAASDYGAAITFNANNTLNYNPAGISAFQMLAAGESVVDSFNYSITDGNEGNATATVNITVNGVNDLPVITSADVLAVVAGDPYSVAYTATDVDASDILTWTLITGPIWLSIDSTTGVLSGSPTTEHAGLHNVSVSVSDGNSGIAYSNFTLTVLADTDGDGTPDSIDDDDDDDGVLDDDDDFPLDPDEDTDTDGDGIGDNADTDDDDDGVDDVDDDFPLDPDEDTDTDGDGTGDNADTDDDGDGVLDPVDDFPYDANETTDTDGDGIGNNADTDDDGDGVADSEDAFPVNANETLDTDDDGIGNNADTDDDGDGVADVDDAFPLNSSETIDTDGDGIGNNADTDDDGDGVPDTDDQDPLDSTVGAEEEPSYTWLYLVIVIVFVAIVGAIMALNRKSGDEDEEPDEPHDEQERDDTPVEPEESDDDFEEGASEEAGPDDETPEPDGEDEEFGENAEEDNIRE